MRRAYRRAHTACLFMEQFFPGDYLEDCPVFVLVTALFHQHLGTESHKRRVRNCFCPGDYLEDCPISPALHLGVEHSFKVVDNVVFISLDN